MADLDGSLTKRVLLRGSFAQEGALSARFKVLLKGFSWQIWTD